MNTDKIEWDESKNQINIRKHHVSFEEAVAVFNDENIIIIEDEDHSETEPRYYAIGKVNEEILTLRFTYRNSKYRIFGAGYWRKGKKYYEEKYQI